MALFLLGFDQKFLRGVEERRGSHALDGAISLGDVGPVVIEKGETKSMQSK